MSSNPLLKRRPNVLLYDWDNTLVDGWIGIAGALNAAFAAFDKPLWTVEETRARVRVALKESFPLMFGDRWTEARDIFYAAFNANHLEHLRPMPGAEAALTAGQAWPQGVVSNKAGGFLRLEVAHLGWDRYFAAIVGAGDAVADKPDPAPIHLALERMDRTADKAVWYLGDTALDMQAARAAGVVAVLIGAADHDGGVERAAPDIHFSSAHDLADCLHKLA